jgi:hypothetical protein
LFKTKYLKMKNLIVVAFLAFFATAGMAQHETIFGSARVVGGFGGPIIEFGLSNDIGNAIGGGGGIVINNFFFGGYGMGTVDFEALIDDELTEIGLGHGGFWLGSTYRPHKVLHLYGSARIGWGAIEIPVDQPDVRFEELDKVFVVTPELGVELNVTRWFRLGATVGYRILQGANEANGYTNNDFQGAVAGLTLRFGWFGSHRDRDRNDND